MKIAVTYENGQVFQHFGHTEAFKIYDVEDGKITGSEVADTNGSGHGALAGFLKEKGVDTLICGGIGGGARTALAEAGIDLYPGASGSADEQVEALIGGTLAYDPDTMCSHHGHGHEDGHDCGSHGEGHSCGDHGCGNH
ncbi:NifB/NifX family molybdenum-iron cluster-binding protein [Bacilliculturomica massiliensis]|uniref:NifB/NifX family molybdenum-iron cluster-binding protein n=1 Tax=Bacilliculturomica massiliensis TaxID=1917867 RepID=UPI0010303606